MEKTTDSNRLWTFFAIALLGFWLLAAPATFGFHSRPLIVSNWICGILLIFLGLKGRRNLSVIQIWLVAAIGIWLQFTPLIFWAPEAAAYLNDTLIGALLILLTLILYPLPGTLPDAEPSVPPGWSYNPSAWPTRLVIGFLAFCCWMISRYLSAYQLGYIDTVWEPFFTPGTESVLESTVSKAFPVSDAGLGAMAYTFEFFSTWLGGKNRWRTAPWAVLIFGILVIPVSLVSVVLIILQPLAVGTWCTLCLLTAICMLSGIPFAIGEVAATLQYLKCSKEKPFFSLLLKGGLCPKATKDRTTPPLDSPLISLWRSACMGITAPWNLLASLIVGLCFMVAPSMFKLQGMAADTDPIVGALAVVVSVISMAEAIRCLRYLNCLFGIWMLAQLFWLDSTLLATAYHGLAGVLLIALAFRKGPIREKSVTI